MSKSIKTADLTGRVAIITGSSRGIGRECALALAALGCNIVVAAKTVQPQPTLPGTIYTVAEEVEKLGVKALPFQLDLRNAEQCAACVEATVATFGRVDILINNASALWWQDIPDTPSKKYDLITQINARGSFLMTQACLPHMIAADWGHVVTMSPPITSSGMSGHTAYNISKMGMTMVALGVAQESRAQGRNIAGNSLWPATIVESLASINFEMGDRSLWRKATVLSDCVVALCSTEPRDFSGHMLYDDDYLRQQQGFGDADMDQYACVPGSDPPLLLKQAIDAGEVGGFDATTFKRGSVNDLKQDNQRSKL
jgi:citronellol/citronellal dehydrogenase